ncbi:VOC family protein [Streptomyces sp. NPDC088745]|uniref:VOC family protein n=1 Tax=Streptomyces sp. NPDC088745 TaxID=3365884 RepID=UPI0037FD9282
MVTRIDLTLDCADAQLLRAFWKTALGYVDNPPPAPFRTTEEWFASLGLPEGESVEDGAWLCDPAGAGPRLSLLKVPEPKTAKNRLHIDVRIPGHGSAAERNARLAAEVVRLKEAGGSVLAEVEGRHVVMADPEGNEFCVALAAG